MGNTRLMKNEHKKVTVFKYKLYCLNCTSVEIFTVHCEREKSNIHVVCKLKNEVL